MHKIGNNGLSKIEEKKIILKIWMLSEIKLNKASLKRRKIISMQDFYFINNFKYVFLMERTLILGNIYGLIGLRGMVSKRKIPGIKGNIEGNSIFKERLSEFFFSEQETKILYISLAWLLLKNLSNSNFATYFIWYLI